MINILNTRINRANYIYQTRGFSHLIMQIIRFLFSQYRVFFQYSHYYLYEHTLEELNEADFLPSIQNYVFKIVNSVEQADKLVTDGFEFPEDITKARYRLTRGAIAFCIFVDSKLAHIGWVALTDEAKKTFDSVPYKVNFSNRQACTGGTSTILEYEGRGLMSYCYFRRFQFLNEQGMISSRNAVEVSNVASKKVHAKFNPRIYAKGRYIRILWWKSWKEIPIQSTENN